MILSKEGINLDFKIIGSNIQKKRKKLKMTQKELANIIGKAESSIQKYEAGKVEIPFNVLEDIYSALNCDLSDLIDDFTFMEIENNIDIERNKYLISLGYQIDFNNKGDMVIIKYNGYSYSIPSIEYLSLLNEIDHHTHYAIDKIIEKHNTTKQPYNDYQLILKNTIKI